jgi:hypothetical protein
VDDEVVDRDPGDSGRPLGAASCSIRDWPGDSGTGAMTAWGVVEAAGAVLAGAGEAGA